MSTEVGDVGQIVFSGQLLVALLIALLAGLVAFASPCVLPLVPGYLAYVGSFSDPGVKRDRSRLLIGVALFVLGFGIVFIAYGAAFGALGFWLVRWQDVVVRILGAFVIVMGLVFIGQFSFLQRTIKPSWRPATGLIGAPVLGIVFGLGWTPCIGPTLAAISALSVGSGSFALARSPARPVLLHRPRHPVPPGRPRLRQGGGIRRFPEETHSRDQYHWRRAPGSHRHPDGDRSVERAHVTVLGGDPRF